MHYIVDNNAHSNLRYPFKCIIHMALPTQRPLLLTLCPGILLLLLIHAEAGLTVGCRKIAEAEAGLKVGCSKIAEAEAAVSVNEKKWLVMHMHVQLKLDVLRGPPTLGSL
jgi:hypothetical protein